MENRFDHTSPEEQQGWGAYATPPPVPGQLNSPRSLAGQASLCARVREMLPALLENDGEIRPDGNFSWTEAHVTGLGWVAFDPVNGICATDSHVRVAVGLKRGRVTQIERTFQQ